MCRSIFHFTLVDDTLSSVVHIAHRFSNVYYTHCSGRSDFLEAIFVVQLLLRHSIQCAACLLYTWFCVSFESTRCRYFTIQRRDVRQCLWQAMAYIEMCVLFTNRNRPPKMATFVWCCVNFHEMWTNNHVVLQHFCSPLPLSISNSPPNSHPSKIDHSPIYSRSPINLFKYSRMQIQ